MEPLATDPFENLTAGEVPAKEYYTMKRLSSDAQPKLTGTDRPRLSSYANDGGFTPIAQVEGLELLIQSIETIETQFGSAYKLGVVEEETGVVHVLCCGQVVIKKALENLCNEAREEGREVQFPIPARFVKPGNAWLIR